MTSGATQATALKASIVIPTWNRPEYLPSAVRSALAALPANSEVVVTDDRSNPPALACLGDFDPSVVRVVINDGARGASANRNFGVRRARGEIIFFLDDDDEMRAGYPNAVLNMLQSIESAWGFSGIAPYSDNPNEFPRHLEPLTVTTLPFRKRLGGLGCGFWIVRDLFLEVGGIEETLSINEDTELSLRLLSAGEMPMISSEPGVFVRRHDAGLTATSSPAERARCFRYIIERHALYLAEHPEALKHLRRRLLKMLAKDGRLREGWREARKGGTPSDLGYFLTALATSRL